MTDFPSDFMEYGDDCPDCGVPMVIEHGQHVGGSNTPPGGYQEPDTQFCDNPECPSNKVPQ